MVMVMIRSSGQVVGVVYPSLGSASREPPSRTRCSGVDVISDNSVPGAWFLFPETCFDFDFAIEN
jgi:hypothetical protein